MLFITLVTWTKKPFSDGIIPCSGKRSKYAAFSSDQTFAILSIPDNVHSSVPQIRPAGYGFPRRCQPELLFPEVSERLEK